VATAVGVVAAGRGVCVVVDDSKTKQEYTRILSKLFANLPNRLRKLQ